MKINFASEIKSRISTKEVFEHYGFEVNRAGFCLCPFHSEKTPSMKIYDGDGGFFCFGCQKSGDMFDFVTEYFNIQFNSAVEKLNMDFSLGLPIGRKMKLSEKHRLERESAKINAHKKAQKEELEKIESNLDKLESEYAILDKTIRESEPLSDEWSDAVKKIDQVKFEIDTYETRRYEYDRRKHNYNA